MRLRRILHLPLRDTLMAAEAAALLALACVALRLISYRALMRRLPAGSRVAPPVMARDIAVAMRRAARLFGPDLCLREAVAARVMLARHGYAGEICVGMRQDANGTPAAHAWLVSGDYVVTGGSAEDLRGFATFSPVGTATP